MKIEQTHTIDDDFANALVEITKKSKAFFNFKIMMLVIAAISLGFGLYKGFSSGFDGTFLMSVVITIFIVVVDFYFFPKMAVTKARQNYDALLGTTVTYSADDEGFGISSEFGEKEASADFVKQRFDLEKYVGIMLKDNRVLLFAKDKLSESETLWLLNKEN